MNEQQTPIRFRRPWEDDDGTTSNINKILDENMESNVEPIFKEDHEDIKVFKFDKEKLVLTSERVLIKRESLDSPASTSSTSSSSLSQNDLKIPYPASVIKTDNDMEVGDTNNTNEGEEEIGEYTEIDEDEESQSNDDSSAGVDEFNVEGRNKERKNSKWADYGVTRKSSRLLPSRAKFCNEAHKTELLKKLTSLLKKSPNELSDEDKLSLTAFPELTREAKKRLEKRRLATERLKEEEDPPDVLDKKCVRLAQVIRRSKFLVVYTGAGISTSASIPDYRGPNGIWTLLRKGQCVADDLKQSPQSADPTLTHMAIKELHSRGIVKHIVSQNVDGLHLRSGVPKTSLSEVHGNMYIEVCPECRREYVRLFDVTENTRRHHHKTGRYCYHCGTALKDSVVLFGEKGSLRWPINWAGAEYHVNKADVILCLGSSLKVLRRYPWLWSMSKPVKQRPKLYIVNLQWTPKDRFSALKINGRCDEVISRVMENLGMEIPPYNRENDSIFSIATPLHASETSSKTSKDLIFPEGLPYPAKSTDLNNYFRFEPTFSKEVRALNQVKRRMVDGEDSDADNLDSKVKNSSGVGWLGNALSIKPKKKKVK